MSEELFLAHYAAGHLKVKDILDYVDSKLAEGLYSDTYIEILDATPQDWDEISKCFEKLILEEKKLIPTLENAAILILESHVKLITLGEVEPFSQFGKLLSDIQFYDYYNKSEKYYGDCIGLQNLYARYHEDCATRDEINNWLIEESENWLTQYSKNH